MFLFLSQILNNEAPIKVMAEWLRVKSTRTFGFFIAENKSGGSFQ